MGAAGSLIAAIASGTVEAGAVAASAMSSVAGAITHPHLSTAVDEVSTTSARAHQGLGAGISALSAFATNSAATIEDTDRNMGAALPEASSL